MVMWGSGEHITVIIYAVVAYSNWLSLWLPWVRSW